MSRKMKRLTKEQKQAAQALLEETQEAQTRFWALLVQLEAATGAEINGANDLTNCTLDQIRRGEATYA